MIVCSRTVNAFTMTIDPFVGTWLSIGSVSYRSKLEFIDGKPDPMGVVNWLNGKGDNSIADITPAEGLTLTITKEGDFQEEKTAEPEIQWFNASGELSPDIQPFSGTLSEYHLKVYLIDNDAPHWSKSKSKPKKNRYADGDTTIADMLEIRDEKLVRTVSVVTDEMYFDRVIIVYQRQEQ